MYLDYLTGLRTTVMQPKLYAVFCLYIKTSNNNNYSISCYSTNSHTSCYCAGDNFRHSIYIRSFINTALFSLLHSKRKTHAKQISLTKRKDVRTWNFRRSVCIYIRVAVNFEINFFIFYLNHAIYFYLPTTGYSNRKQFVIQNISFHKTQKL